MKKKQTGSPRGRRYGTGLLVRIFISVLMVCLAADLKDSAPKRCEDVRRALTEQTDFSALSDTVSSFWHDREIFTGNGT